MAAGTSAGGKGAAFRSAIIGVCVLIGIIGLLTIAWNAKKGPPWASETYYTIAFQDVGDLKIGSDLRIGQTRVGRVSDITLDSERERVLVEIEVPTGEVPEVYRNATATVVSRSALGQKYVEFDPGDPSSGVLAEDAVIPATQTRDETKLTDLLQMFDKSTRAATASTVQQLGAGTAGHGADLDAFLSEAPTMLPDLGTVSAALATNDGQNLTRMLQSLESLSARFTGRTQQINSLLGNLGTTLDAFAVDDGAALRQTLEVAPQAMRETRSALRDLQQPLRTTTSAVRKVEPGAEALAAATPDLRGVLRESQRPLGKVPEVAEQAEPALEGLTEVMHDARPLAPKVTRAFGLASPQLNYLAPYSDIMANGFTNLASSVSHGNADGHHLTFYVVPATDAVSGNVPIQDPTINRDAYTKPGDVNEQRKSKLEKLPLLGGLAGGGQ